MGRISTSPRYMIEITGPYPLSLGELGGGRISSGLASSVLLEML